MTGAVGRFQHFANRVVSLVFTVEALRTWAAAVVLVGLFSQFTVHLLLFYLYLTFNYLRLYYNNS